MSDKTTEKRRLSSIWPILVVGLLACAGFAALGIWQLERLAWKNALIEAVETRSSGAPLDLDQIDWGSIEPEAMAYQRVSVTGRFGPQTALVQAVTAAGSGFWVMAPFHLADGRILLVNRGFVSQDAGDTLASVSEEPLTLTGLLRQTEPDGGFLRSNDPQAGRWFSRDVAAIGKEMGLPDMPLFFIDADHRQDADVLGGLTVLTFSNNHLIYALTWFALSIFVMGALIFVVRDRARR